MTTQPVPPWKGAFNYLEDLAGKKLNAADYAITVRKLYDILVEDTGDPVAVREFVLLRVSAQQNAGLISQQHHDLVPQLLPKVPRRGKGRPKGALGTKAYVKRYQLYVDWISESTLNPSLTKEKFAMSRLDITDTDLAGAYALHHRANIDAFLQKLKPALMKRLDEGQRRSIDIICPLMLKFPQYLALRWREAKEQSPSLTRQEFLQDYFGWPRDRKLRPLEEHIINEFLKTLDQGEQPLLRSERP